jgi:predicted amidohydrolase
VSVAGKGKIRVATCQFAESFDPCSNAATICRYIRRAKEQRADLVHFHEACLSGYLSRDGAPKAGEVDWAAVKEAGLSVCRQAAESNVWVVLGASHPLSPSHKPTNCLYLINPSGCIVDRYDKRFLTSKDLKVYTPGNRFVTFDLNGVHCALLICFDLRFPEIYRQLSVMGVRAIFQSFNNGYMKGPGIHGLIMRQTVQAHAGMNAFWISANNSAGRYSRWPSVFITPDGAIAASLRSNAPGMMVNTIDTSKHFYDPSARFRAEAIAGKGHSGKTVKDRRMENRTSL